MKRMFIRLLLATLLLVACGSTSALADGNGNPLPAPPPPPPSGAF